MPGAWDIEQTPALLRIGLRAATELVRVHGTRRRQGATATAQSMRVTADTYARRLLELLPPEEEQGLHHAAWRALIAAEHASLEEADTPEDWHRAAETAADAHLLPDRAYALLRHGEALARAARRPEAARALTEAHRLASEIGARVLAAQVERLARRSRLQILPADDSARRRSRSPRGVDELTEREREVLELVTAGHSNRQIAEALFVTEKTAGAHVSNILAKLGASSRGEAAAIAMRDQLLDG
jgi:DNA-binding CsgD family transcriptional regulator